MTTLTACPTLKTRRLVLRAPGATDIDPITDAMQDADTVRWLARVPWPYRRADAEAWVRTAAERAEGGDELAFAIDKGAMIGAISIRYPFAVPELGYWLEDRWRGKGLMTEAASAIVGYTFNTLGANAIVSGTFEGNLASQAVLQRLGFVITGESREPSLFHGSEQTHIDMRLTREAFEANRS